MVLFLLIFCFTLSYFLFTKLFLSLYIIGRNSFIFLYHSRYNFEKIFFKVISAAILTRSYFCSILKENFSIFFRTSLSFFRLVFFILCLTKKKEECVGNNQNNVAYKSHVKLKDVDLIFQESNNTQQRTILLVTLLFLGGEMNWKSIEFYTMRFGKVPRCRMKQELITAKLQSQNRQKTLLLVPLFKEKDTL